MQSILRSVQLGVLAMALMGATTSAAHDGQQELAAAAPSEALPPIDGAAWLVGHWVGTTANGRHIEEMWMPAVDGHMIGSFRWARGNGRWLFEFMSIDVQPADGGPARATSPAPGGAGAATPLVLRIKHFDRGFRGIEEKTESTRLTLADHGPDHLTFESRETRRIVRVGYRRAGPDRLTATFDEMEEGKPAVHLEFPYRRAP